MKTKRKLFYYEKGRRQTGLSPVYTVEWKFKNGSLFPLTVDLAFIVNPRLAVFNDNYFDILRTDVIMDIREVEKLYEITLK